MIVVYSNPYRTSTRVVYVFIVSKHLKSVKGFIIIDNFYVGSIPYIISENSSITDQLSFLSNSKL